MAELAGLSSVNESNEGIGADMSFQVPRHEQVLCSEDTKESCSFSEVYWSNDQNLSVKWSHYLDIYQEFWSKYIGKNPNVLEIGVQNGGSLQIAQRYFVNGNIYGIDIDPKVCEMNLGENIKTYCFDIKDQESFKNFLNDTQFDTILDDGSHKSTDIIQTFKKLFFKLKPGGIYIIEDLHASYWAEFEGGGYLQPTSAIEYLKKIVDLLNAYHIRGDYISTLSQNDFYVFQWVESITFYDSVAIIKKLKEPRSESHKLIYSGKHCPVNCLK